MISSFVSSTHCGPTYILNKNLSEKLWQNMLWNITTWLLSFYYPLS